MICYFYTNQFEKEQVRAPLKNMAVQITREEGWPLGLEPVNVRVGLTRNRELSGSISFNTLLSGSPTSSTDSSSDLDNESTGSFFHDRSITLGSLLGASNIVEISRRSIRSRKSETARKSKKPCKSRTWFFSLCPGNSTDVENTINAQSLGHYLAAERQTANGGGSRTQNQITTYGLDELGFNQSVAESNPLFVNGRVAPPRASPGLEETGGGGCRGLLGFSCMCGQGQAAH